MPPPQRLHDDLLESLLESLMGPGNSGVRGQIQNNGVRRGNTPSRWTDHLPQPGRPLDPGTIWTVDRVLEPQTIAHFLSFMAGGRLPGGAQTSLPILGPDVQLITQPLSQWAPAPFNRPGPPIVHALMSRVGSFEDGGRLQCISKNLQAMKSRIWEGVMPFSDRRWKDKKLHETENFNEACQFITDVVSVFHYLNQPRVKACLRETYNLIYDHLRDFEHALNAKRLSESREPVRPTLLWAEYMRSHYAYMETRTHAWLSARLNEMKEQVITALARYQPSNLGGDAFDEHQWVLTNMWQDISENFAHADFAIFIPMDGYKGCTSASATGRPLAAGNEYFGTAPLQFSTNIDKRLKNYHLRRRHILLMNDMNYAAQNAPTAHEPLNSPSSLVRTCRNQAASQDQARLELRGPAPNMGPESFVLETTEHSEWGFVAYRAHYGQTDAEWTEFKTKFDADASDWGKDLSGVDEIRARSTIHWLDARELGLAENDVDALKRHFATLKVSSEFPAKVVKDIFLVADEASVKSYLNPIPESPAILLPPGDLGGFILAVDQDFDPSEPREREDESPGYDGTLRVLSSILWDDLSALLAMQTAHLEDLWPLAMNHPLGVYVGPVVRNQLGAWRGVRMMINQFYSSYMKWEDEHGTAGAGSSS